MPTSAQEERELREAATAMRAVGKRYFPTFESVMREARHLAVSDKVLLTFTMFLLVAITWCAVLVSWFIGGHQSLLAKTGSFLPQWTFTCLTLIGGWSALGAGRWHWRFPAACMAGLWLLTAALYLTEYTPLSRSYESDRFVAQSIAAFVLGAFAAAWIRSIGQVEFARATAPPTAPRLRSHQFNLRVMFTAMLSAAIVLGLVQSPPTLWTGLQHAPRELGRIDNHHWEALLIPVATAAAALILSMRAWRFVLLAVAGAVALLILIPGISSRDWHTAIHTIKYFGWPVATSLASAMIPIVWLRLWGFQLRRVPDAPRAASPA